MKTILPVGIAVLLLSAFFMLLGGCAAFNSQVNLSWTHVGDTNAEATVPAGVVP